MFALKISYKIVASFTENYPSYARPNASVFVHFSMFLHMNLQFDRATIFWLD